MIGFFLGAVIGAFLAWRRKGNRLDILHYCVVYGLAFAILNLFVNVILSRIG